MSVFAGLFEVVAGVTVAWFLVLLFARDLVFNLLGAPSAFVVNTSLKGALVILSGPLLLDHFRSFPYEDRERGSGRGRSFSTRSCTLCPCSSSRSPSCVPDPVRLRASKSTV